MDQDIEIEASPEFAALLKQYCEEHSAKEEVAALIAAPLPKHIQHMFR